MSEHISWQNRGGLMALAVLGCVLFEKTCSTPTQKEAAMADFKSRIEALADRLSNPPSQQLTPIVVEWPSNTDLIDGFTSFASYLEGVLTQGPDKEFTYPF